MNVLQRLGTYMGNRKPLLPISLVLSGLTGLVSLLPFIFVWLIVHQLLGGLSGLPYWLFCLAFSLLSSRTLRDFGLSAPCGALLCRG